ncbi:MAG: CpsD/CapB family tyrosine-protein kinase [Acetivibrionales bacterium]|jgi:protein-tyrosine kinase
MNMQTAKEVIDKAVNDAHRVVQINIAFYGLKEGKIKSITVTSANTREGKTTVSINLAMSMAEAGMKVLYIDADLRKSSTPKNLGRGIKYGLSNLLSEYVPLRQALIPTQTKNLFCIASGSKPPNPSELINSSVFERLLNIVSTGFDIVIIDTPSLGEVIDAALIAGRTDVTIVVVGSKGTGVRNVKRIMKKLEKSNARLLGMIMNKVDRCEYENN